MGEDLYTMAGTVKIPDNRKAEFNDSVLKLLYLGGIRKTEEMELGGKKITVVSRPMPDENGIVRFDYSIFEKYKRDINTYNMNTCELDTPDRGYQEVGVIMNAVMIMQEAYSEGSCYYMAGGKPGKVEAYAALIRDLIGADLTFPERSRMWEMLLFFHHTEEYKNVTDDDIWEAYPWGSCDFLSEHFMTIIHLEPRLSVPEKRFEGGKKDFAKAPKVSLLYYIYEKTALLVENGEGEKLMCYLKRLLDSEHKDRVALAAEDTVYGEIAEASLYLLPPLIVNVYAVASGQGFWETWDSMGIKGYSDVIVRKRDTDSPKDRSSLPLYKAIQREDEDEFLEYWDSQELKLSDKMKKCFQDWKERFEKIIPDKNFETEPFLAEILAELEEYGKCRLVDKSFVTDVLEHRDDSNYQKVLLLYKEILDKDQKYFPELTHRQAIRWIMRRSRAEFDYKEMAAFPSLLMNRKHRLEILGF
ncbi:hypothetical protein [Enterocloster lavalensis]|uniref:hypothetical protein n=1 Tax=Enterocloster lavalensis TaxID=460384 RepID=UPI0023F21CB0|nr:hypothetical protein [Enterocloster lavalensis]